MEREQLEKMVEEIHRAIVGDIQGNPGFNERIRLLECFKNNLTKGLNFIVGLAITEAAGIAALGIIAFLKIKGSS